MMTNYDLDWITNKNLIMQARAFACVFIKHADRAIDGSPNQAHVAAAQLRAALEALPPSIRGCFCHCEDFMRPC